VRIAGGQFKGRQLPDAGDARPVGARLKDSLFSVIEGDLAGARVLDLCAGVGGLGLEALSRGAESVLLVERDPAAVAALVAWIDRADCREQARVMRGDALGGPPSKERFDIVFLDPPFEAWDDEEPVALLGRAMDSADKKGLLVVKTPAEVQIPDDSRWRLLRRGRYMLGHQRGRVHRGRRRLPG